MNRFDVCVVGSGPVGLAAAIECGERGLSVALIESGRLGPPDGEAQRLADQEILDPSRHAPAALTVRRGFGGTSATWCGRCVPYDSIDFEPRDWVSDIGWPIRLADIKSHYQAAAEYLDIGTAAFRAPPTINGRIHNAGLERWTRQTQTATANRDRLAAARSVAVHPGLTATDLLLNHGGDAALALHCRRTFDAEPIVVEADHIILAAGGIENARLLLNVQRTWPQKFGGLDGPLGRYYQGHLYGRIADIVFTAEDVQKDFDFNLDYAGVYTRRRLTISPDEQRRRQLLNICFLPDSPLFHDHARGDGALSALFLAMACPPLGRRFLHETIRLQQVGPPPRAYWPHVWNILRSPVTTARNLARIIDQRYHQAASKPGLYDSKSGVYPLYYHAEHAPDPNSRVMLADRRDALGLLRARIDLRFARMNATSVVAAHQALDSSLRAYHLGYLDYHTDNGDRLDLVNSQASDGYHQIGMTRMSSRPADGVVDPNCRIHDLANVYVAGSSVFPTSSQANPTFMAVALAVRLAKVMQSRAQTIAFLPAVTPV